MLSEALIRVKLELSISHLFCLIRHITKPLPYAHTCAAHAFAYLIIPPKNWMLVKPCTYECTHGCAHICVHMNSSCFKRCVRNPQKSGKMLYLFSTITVSFPVEASIFGTLKTFKKAKLITISIGKLRQLCQIGEFEFFMQKTHCSFELEKTVSGNNCKVITFNQIHQ